MSQPNILICNPVDPAQPIARIAGSQQKNCERCKTAVWVSPGSLLTIAAAREPFLVLCPGCGMEAMRRSPDEIEIMPPSGAQLREISVAMGGPGL